ncbi:ornithine cyclodeaminase [Shewanella sp. OPT22]|nr:ornithine cyclodeaminase [Shewanella sp. OPT22]
MLLLDENHVRQTLSFEALISTLKRTFSQPFGMPQRQVFELEPNSENHDAFAVLPSWSEETIAVKAFTYMPDNPKHSDKLKSIYAQIMIFDRKTGVPQAVVDGTSATYWRTAAVSGLASQLLARESASKLLLCGTGNLASYMALAHACVRDITQIRVWGRSSEKIDAVISEIKAKRPDIEVSRCTDLNESVGWADIISCATRSPEPLFDGSLVSEGTHVDLVGNHLKTARECDSQLLSRSSVFVDSKVNCFAEAGELLLPVSEGVFSLDEVKAELTDLCKGEHNGRQTDEEITLFKSVGSAIGDLATAQLVYQHSK